MNHSLVKCFLIFMLHKILKTRGGHVLLGFFDITIYEILISNNSLLHKHLIYLIFRRKKRLCCLTIWRKKLFYLRGCLTFHRFDITKLRILLRINLIWLMNIAKHIAGAILLQLILIFRRYLRFNFLQLIVDKGHGL